MRNISCACEQQQGAFSSMFAVCNIDYIVDISSSDNLYRGEKSIRAKPVEASH